MDATCLAETLWLAARMREEPPPALSGTMPPSPEAQPNRHDQPGVSSPRFPSLIRDFPPVPPPFSSARPALHEALPQADATLQGQEVSIPGGRGFSFSLDFARALRPWKQRWTHGPQDLLDVEAIVDHYAQSGELLPEFSSAPERWFDLALIVDQSLSMQVWRHTIRGFEEVLRQLGAFRALHTYTLGLSERGEVELHDQQGRPTRPQQLVSAQSRQLVLLVTDCAAPGWRHDAIWQQLREWGRVACVALVNPLPVRLWRRTGLSLPIARVTQAQRGASNAGFTLDLPASRPGIADLKHWMPIPTVTFSPHSLGRWSQTVMRGAPEGCAAVLIPPSDHPSTLREGRQRPQPRDEEARTEGFLKISGSTVSRLAVLCSTFNRLSMALLHLIRQELVPEATTADVAELMTSGLFQLEAGIEGSVELIVPPKVQARLRRELREYEVWKLTNALTERITADAFQHEAIIAMTAGTGATTQEVPAEAHPFAQAMYETLELLGVNRPYQTEHIEPSDPEPITPGDRTTRAALKGVFGGGSQGGIIPSTTTPNILIFTDPQSGHQYGYHDGWLAPGDSSIPIFEYTGAGTLGDQSFGGRTGSGNKSILNHVQAGRVLRVFAADGRVAGSGTKYQRYIGEFALDPSQPYVVRQAPDSAGNQRNVIVFRFTPIGAYKRDPRDEMPAAEKTTVNIISTASRTHPTPTLVSEFQSHLERRGHTVRRHQIKIAESTRTLLTDVFDTTTQTVYEAVASTSRQDVRLALGRLLDLHRILSNSQVKLGILLPGPLEDSSLKSLLSDNSILTVHRNGDSFTEDVLPL
ncbi:SAV_2336 N-terminal domain-related protein [Streptomyces sp. NPDC001941]|uniref:SAV_2336 N-terminal domain-related protein n=1 Tax=Streptomyces sp. NPDC001941 TaxID=3154659 RepID=UPI00331CB53F